MTTTATVETLTAEVRVLMVGNRQVTLSVARQLDWVDLEDLELFGRVKISDERAAVIGRAPDGSLALARYNRVDNRGVWHLPEDVLPVPIRLCRRTLPLGLYEHEQCYALRLFDFTFHVWSDHPRRDHPSVMACTENGLCDPPCAGWSAQGQEQLLANLVAEYTADKERRNSLHRIARESPLIVLAGLK